MTLTVSTGKKSYFLPYIRHKLISSKTLIIVVCIFNIIAFGALCLMDISYAVYRAFDLYDASFIFISACGFSATAGVISAMIMLACVAVTPTVVSRCNTNRDKADMYLSLPLTSKQRFFGDLITGIVINIAPMVILYIISQVVFLAAQPLVVADSIIVDEFTSTLWLMPLVVLAVGVVTELAIYIIAVFVNSAAGKFSTSVLYSFVVCIAIMLFAYVCGYGFLTGIKGIDFDFSIIFTVITKVPPFGIFFEAIIYLLESISEERVYTIFKAFSPEAVIVYVITGAAFLISAYLMTKKRKAENIGKSFAVGGVYYFVLLLTVCSAEIFTFILASISSYSTDFVIIIAVGLFISAVIFFFMELQARRGFAKFYGWILRFVGITVCAGAIAGFLIYCPVSLDTAYIPKSDETVYVSMRVEGLPIVNGTITAKDKEDMEKVIELHHLIAKSPDTSDGNEISFFYETKTGYKSFSYKIDRQSSKDITADSISGKTAMLISDFLSNDSLITVDITGLLLNENSPQYVKSYERSDLEYISREYKSYIEKGISDKAVIGYSLITATDEKTNTDFSCYLSCCLPLFEEASIFEDKEKFETGLYCFCIRYGDEYYYPDKKIISSEEYKAVRNSVLNIGDCKVELQCITEQYGDTMYFCCDSSQYEKLKEIVAD